MKYIPKIDDYVELWEGKTTFDYGICWTGGLKQPLPPPYQYYTKRIRCKINDVNIHEKQTLPCLSGYDITFSINIDTENTDFYIKGKGKRFISILIDHIATGVRFIPKNKECKLCLKGNGKKMLNEQKNTENKAAFEQDNESVLNRILAIVDISKKENKELTPFEKFIATAKVDNEWTEMPQPLVDHYLSLTKQMESMLPFEKQGKEKLNKEIAKLITVKDSLLRKKFSKMGYLKLDMFMLEKHDLHIQSLNEEYSAKFIESNEYFYIDLNKFTMDYRTQSFEPYFCINADSSKMFKNDDVKISISRESLGYALDKIQRSWSRLKGVLPFKTKSKIKNALNHFSKDNIFIIADTSWKEEPVFVEVQGDPAIVAFDGINLWLIDVFDLVNVEGDWINKIHKEEGENL